MCCSLTPTIKTDATKVESAESIKYLFHFYYIAIQ